VGIALVVQLGLIWLLGERPKPRRLPPEFGLGIWLVPEPTGGISLAQGLGWADPTLFALPALKGFSGRAWMVVRPLEYEPEPWSEPWGWLSLDVGRLGLGSGALLAASARAPLLVADKPLPRLIGAERPVPAVSTRTQSVVRLDGLLAQRRWLDPVVPPSWPHPDVLSNTVVQATVEAGGWVISAVVLQSSGSAQADEFALRQTLQARFEPVAARALTGLDSGLTQGLLIFQWHTVPPTNGLPGSSTP
jgi:hypothetical protein